MIGEKRRVKMYDGTNILCNIFESGKSDWLIVTHGIGEHHGRHSYLMDLLGQRYNILFYDLRGHGDSEGKSAEVDSFNQFIDDLAELIEYIKDEFRAEKYSLFGHSMGALIVSAFMQEKGSEYSPSKVLINAPPVAYPGALGKIVGLLSPSFVERLSRFKKGIYLKGLVDLNGLSHDVCIAKKYVEDPKNRLELNTKLLFGMIESSKRTFSKPINPRVPMYCSIGSMDTVVDPNAAINYFGGVETKVRLKVIEGAYHEIHNEVSKYQVPYFDYIKSCLL